MKRRRVLASVAGLAASSGCLDSVPSGRPGGGPTARSTPAPVSGTPGAGPPAVEWAREYAAEGVESTHTPNGSPALYGRAVVRTADGGFALTGQQSERGEGLDGYLQVTDAAGETRWLAEYGGEYSNATHEYGDDGLNRGYCLARTRDGGYVLGGIQPSGTAASTSTGWVLHADAEGTVSWWTGPAGGSRAGVRDVVQTNDGGYALAGWIAAESGVGGWFARLDRTGETVVSERYDRADDDPAAIAEGFRALAETADGGFVLVGESPAGGWLVGTDADGAVRWERTLAAPYVRANDVVATGDGNALVVGRSTNGGQNPTYTVTDAENPSDLALTFVDGAGAVRWTRTADGGGNEFGRAVIATADGGYAAVGGRTRHRERGVFLVKTDASGREEWSETYLVGGSVVGEDLAQATDGGFAVAARGTFVKLAY